MINRTDFIKAYALLANRAREPTQRYAILAYYRKLIIKAAAKTAFPLQVILFSLVSTYMTERGKDKMPRKPIRAAPMYD